MTRATTILITRFNRDRYGADAVLGGLDEDFALEYETRVRQILQEFEHSRE